MPLAAANLASPRSRGLDTAEARLAAILLLVAAAGSLGLIQALRREALG